MEKTECNINIVDFRKEKRFQTKKRKLEALLNLFQEEEKIEQLEKKKKNTTLQEDYKTLKNELKHFMKKPEVEPRFYLSDIGYKHQLQLTKNKISKKIKPLFVENVYQLLLKSVIGHMSPYDLNWAKVEQPQNISKTVLLVVEGLSKDVIIENRSCLKNLIEIFPYIVGIASPNLSFPLELTTLHKVTHFHIENDDTYSTMFPNKKVVKVEKDENVKRPSKLHLLLSPIQLVMENYPLPQNVFQYSKSDQYTFSKDSYKPVTAQSPMFALDCEMCGTEKCGNELTRVAVINEKLKVVYETLVKPSSKITDYRTKFSGITKSMLKGVKTRLTEVQKELRNIFPPDAILCGQSLNCDLHALKMIHPYVIDTSIIFNCSGIRSKKDSLKYLTKYYLKEDIQNSKDGHDPIEDALATMKLVQLKLENTVQFGDVCLQPNYLCNDGHEEVTTVNNNSEEKAVENQEKDSPGEKSVEMQSKSSSEEKQDEVSSEEKADEQQNECSSEEKALEEHDKLGFFALTSKYGKKICLIGDENALDLYKETPNTVQKISKSSAKKVIKATLNQIENFDLTVSHVNFNGDCKTDVIGELDQIVKQVFDCLSNRTMFMLLTSDIDKSNFKDIRSGIFMANVKKL